MDQPSAEKRSERVVLACVQCRNRHVKCDAEQPQNRVTFQIDNDRLLELFFENFWSSFPIVLPYPYLQTRRLKANHGMPVLLLVLQWIGSLYAPWVPSEPYREAALKAVASPTLERTPFNVQSLMLFALAEFYCDRKSQARKRLETAVTLALELSMNERDFAHAYGEGDAVLEESWRRTYYLLYCVDQHFAVVTNTPFHVLLAVPSNVDLPCDDEYYQRGQIPPVSTWAEYQLREFTEIEVVYSSITYLYDAAMIVAFIMSTFIHTAVINEALVESCDVKLAIWMSLLPSCKKDPVRMNGEVDEIMFMAHMVIAIIMSTVHRPFSSLGYCPGEMSTRGFIAPSPFTLVPKAGRNSHTARVLKATEIATRLLAIPCALEKHNIFTAYMTAQMAAVQIAACIYLLDGHALSIARDRVSLSIGFLKTMGSTWPLGKVMAMEVQAIARLSFSGTSTQHTGSKGVEPVAAEIELPRDEVVSPIDPSAQIDIYAGLTLPVDFSTTPFGYPNCWS
ncbi:hypothetical protein COCMIDRAFT_35963 [Bipolaris oryzae ATCC 44560]|uniref:Transcription factor domain-containing protein n=1 Tax=Bipolaris oryzae ATCC 44560 TaxID=930090 RepID=W6Z995_COCMI|nr:uncharacterized protein COCMIDRAFT_35963 [Bipolaris oryzae ATCC 44560]EUC46343.1 hypothetical protein COCMIDRAFT_35963 [Bipolaris oryzae ATCC 44560]